MQGLRPLKKNTIWTDYQAIDENLSKRIFFKLLCEIINVLLASL